MNLWRIWENKTNRQAVFWWIVLWSQIAAALLAYHAGYLQQMYNGDSTKLCVLILAIHLLCSIKIGLDTFAKTDRNVRHFVFVEKSVVRLGLLGTVLGFLILMGTAFAAGVPTAAGIAKVLNGMLSGLGTALWTTAIGIVSALLLDLQMNNLETACGASKT